MISKFFCFFFTILVPAAKSKTAKRCKIRLLTKPNLEEVVIFEVLDSKSNARIGSCYYFISYKVLTFTFMCPHRLIHFQKFAIHTACKSILLECIKTCRSACRSLTTHKIGELLLMYYPPTSVCKALNWHPICHFAGTRKSLNR